MLVPAVSAIGADNARECLVAKVLGGMSSSFKMVGGGAMSLSVACFPVFDRRIE